MKVGSEYLHWSRTGDIFCLFLALETISFSSTSGRKMKKERFLIQVVTDKINSLGIAIGLLNAMNS